MAAFIDESGDIGLKKPGSLYITTATVFDSRDLPAVRTELRQIITDNWDGTQPDELHFSKIPKSKRPAVLSALASCLADHHGRVVVSTGQKDNFLTHLLRCEAEHRRDEETPIITHWPDVLVDTNGQTGRMMLMLLVEDLIAHVGAQALHEGASLAVCHDRKHKEWMNDALSEGFERSRSTIPHIAEVIYGKALCPQLSFKLEHSPAEPCLWLSDWVAWEAGRWARGKALSSAFQDCVTLMTFLHFDDIGRRVQTRELGGAVINYFPDYSRDIQSLCRKRVNNTEGQTGLH
jgi:hypothetical protein